MGPRGDGIVLIGIRRSGKTTVGRLLASALGRAFVDTDEVVTALAGSSPAEIILAEGEDVFREVEEQAVGEAVHQRGAVVAVGGGAPLRERNRHLLRAHGAVILLRVEESALAGRMKREENPSSRPLLDGQDAMAEARLHLSRRQPRYSAWADHEVDGGNEPEVVCRECLDALGLD